MCNLGDERDVAFDLRGRDKPRNILIVDEHGQSGAFCRDKAKARRAGEGDE
jgi:hypothetical protein